MKDSKKTVVFNVGGKHFEVARSTLDKYQDSMLARLASDTWEGNKDEPIFVDASSERFDFVLDYMRHNTIDVPMNTARDAVIKDLNYFCLPFEESQIKVSRKHGSSRMVKILKEISDHEKACSERTSLLRKERDYINFAHWCVAKQSEYCNGDPEFKVVVSQRAIYDRYTFPTEFFVGVLFDSVLCQECLAEVGLEITADEQRTSEDRRFTLRSL